MEHMDDLKQASSSLVARVKAILLQPKLEWPVIAVEPTSANSLFFNYAVPLAAIGPVCTFLHNQIFGYGVFGFSWHPSLIGSLASLVATYILSLVGLFVLALIANFLAPKFDGVADRQAALKLVIYGATASYIAGFANLLPGLGILALLGLYSFYLFYVGAGPLLKVPAEKALSFTAVTVVCAIVLGFVVSAALAPLAYMYGGPAAITNTYTSDAGKVALPGGGVLDLDKMKQATDQMQNATSGKKPPISASALQTLLPTSIGAFQRTAVESTGVGGLGSNADGTYTAGGHTYHLKITDMAAMGALAGLGTAMGVEDSKQDADGYEKTGTVDGRLQTEEWHTSSSSGKFGFMVANRFMIEAEGNAGSIDDLKAAVATIDQGRLAALGS